MKKAEITVQLIDYMGSDVSVVNAARISFDKIKDEFDEQDERLVNYLAEHNHWSPFAHTSIQVRVKAPFALARQLGKHQVGLVWNEVSRRYVSSEPEFWFPEEVHRAPVNAKQGAGNVHEWSGSAVGSMVNSTRDTLGLYEFQLTAARRRLEKSLQSFPLTGWFQLTAARRRLVPPLKPLTGKACIALFR